MKSAMLQPPPTFYRMIEAHGDLLPRYH